MSVRVGFIGAGGIANAHMNMLQAIEDVQIVAVTDVDRDRAESTAAKYLAKPYADYREMISSEHMDALYICVPPFAHECQELTAIEKGIHLFVEKPVARSLETAGRIRDAIEKNKIISAVGYHWRYLTTTDRAMQILSGRTIGMVQGYWMGGMPCVSWWRNMNESGGQMVDQTTHIFDLARYLCGEIDEVFALYSRRDLDDRSDIYDVGTASLKFKSGAVGCISNTCMLSLPYTVGLDIIAKDLVLEIHGDLKVIEPGHTEVFTSGANSMLAENRAFIDAIRLGNTDNIRSTYSDAMKTLAVTLACNESAETGMPVGVKSL
ncbi:Gfo/Idh/MocA family oxidoreductase [bacterium]|nr:Gfo/Idh/MocA family oxidoreductase [bacterium]